MRTLLTFSLQCHAERGKNVALVIDHNGVITLNLSALVSAGGNVAVTNNDHLLTIDMPSLTEVTGDVTEKDGKMMIASDALKMIKR